MSFFINLVGLLLLAALCLVIGANIAEAQNLSISQCKVLGAWYWYIASAIEAGIGLDILAEQWALQWGAPDDVIGANLNSIVGALKNGVTPLQIEAYVYGTCAPNV